MGLATGYEKPLQTRIFAEAGGGFSVHHRLEVDDLLEQNRQFRSIYGKGIRRKHGSIQSGSMGRPLADLDLLTYMNLHKAGILQDKKRFKKWLNDPDNRFFRITEGRA